MTLHKRGGNYNPTGIGGGKKPPAVATANINVRCSPEFKALVKDKAKEFRFKSQAEFLEAAVDEYIKNHS